MNNCMTGLFNSIDPDIPHNAGTFRRVKVQLRENCVVGIPTFPHSCSVATTNVGERLVVTTQRAIADALGRLRARRGRVRDRPGLRRRLGHRLAQGRRRPTSTRSSSARRAGRPGPEHDGWITYGNAVTNGLMFRDSVEIDEQKYPIRVREIRIRPDSEGAGRRRGAPGRGRRLRAEARPDEGRVRHRRLPQPAARHARRRRRRAVGPVPGARRRHARSRCGRSRRWCIAPGELLGHLLSGAAATATRCEREPELVRDDVLARFVSFERARDVYGVVFVRRCSTTRSTVDEARRPSAAARGGAGDR